MSTKRLVDVLKGLKGMGQGDPRAWAHKLRDREQAGEELSIAQRQMWRDALNSAGPIFARELLTDGDVNEAKREAARRVAEYQGGIHAQQRQS